MLIHCLFAQRHESYTGQYGLELIASVLDYEYDDYPDYFDGEVSRTAASDEFSDHRVIDLQISQDELERVFKSKPRLQAKVVNGN